MRNSLVLNAVVPNAVVLKTPGFPDGPSARPLGSERGMLRRIVLPSVCADLAAVHLNANAETFGKVPLHLCNFAHDGARFRIGVGRADQAGIIKTS